MSVKSLNFAIENGIGMFINLNNFMQSSSGTIADSYPCQDSGRLAKIVHRDRQRVIHACTHIGIHGHMHTRIDTLERGLPSLGDVLLPFPKSLMPVLNITEKRGEKCCIAY